MFLVTQPPIVTPPHPPPPKIKIFVIFYNSKGPPPMKLEVLLKHALLAGGAFALLFSLRDRRHCLVLACAISAIFLWNANPPPTIKKPCLRQILIAFKKRVESMKTVQEFADFFEVSQTL